MVAISKIWLISSDESEFEREREPSLFVRAWELCSAVPSVRGFRVTGCLGPAPKLMRESEAREDRKGLEKAEKRPPCLGDTDGGSS